LLGLNGCAGMSRQGENTAIGAGVGAIGGALVVTKPANAIDNAHGLPAWRVAVEHACCLVLQRGNPPTMR
jgi:hypothetical protein